MIEYTSFHNLLASPEFIAAIIFAVLLVVYERLLFPVSVIFIPEQLSRSWRFVAQIVCLLLVVSYIGISFTCSLSVRALFLGLFILAVAGEYGSNYSVGRFSVSDDYDMVLRLFDPTLYKAALVGFSGRVWPAVLLPVLAYTALLFGPQPLLLHHNGGLGYFATILLAFIGFFSFLYPFSSGAFRTLSLAAGLRSITYVGWKYATMYRGPRLTVETLSVCPPQDNLVFIVDESIRGDHLSLNGYPRQTTAYLEQLQSQGILYNWRNAVSCATASTNSNVLLLTGINQLPDVAQNTRKMPTIFAYARAMGYHTLYLDLQMNRRWLMSAEDFKQVDEWHTVREFQAEGEYQVDIMAARWLSEKLPAGGRYFVWINKAGAHFPYPERIPPGYAPWQPVLTDGRYDPQEKVRLANTYDNILSYNLENFFRLLVSPETLANTTFVYTSDHGQTLSENGETWPQTGPTRNEARVPVLIIHAHPLQVDQEYQASHQNLFATLLDFMSVPQEMRRFPYALSLLKTTASLSQPRYYIVGDITTRLRSWLYNYDGDKNMPG
jgi:glucan phosphoethanolaminetransferase (alkaline phosphatase superfamily)